MAEVSYEFENLSTREGFNSSLRHFKAVNAIIGDFEGYTNLADIVNNLLSQKRLLQHQVAPIVYALLVDKYGYTHRSYNMSTTVEGFSRVAEDVAKWKAVDLVISYFHPELGLTLINPKNAQHWQTVQSLKKHELVTLYAGAFQKEIAEKLRNDAIDKLIGLIEGKKVSTPAALTKGSFTKILLPELPEDQVKPKRSPGRKAKAGSRSTAAKKVPKQPPAAPEQTQPSATTGKKRMTPFYSVVVTNELFHNGNVEAWKKIIHSYTTKHPGLDVYIFYDGERIHDINTLFKWGKVKHGSSILFSVAGENIKDVAKLQRYLAQGASPRFEDFLRFPVNKVLDLF
jgi:hypothetical protein